MHTKTNEKVNAGLDLNKGSSKTQRDTTWNLDRRHYRLHYMNKETFVMDTKELIGVAYSTPTLWG